MALNYVHAPQVKGTLILRGCRYQHRQLAELLDSFLLCIYTDEPFLNSQAPLVSRGPIRAWQSCEKTMVAPPQLPANLDGEMTEHC